MDLYELYVEQCLCLCLKGDYNEPKKVRAHNSAMDKIAQLETELCQVEHEEVVIRLLAHPDERVKLNAASFCLTNKEHCEEALMVLQKIMEASSDHTLSFSAKMVIKTKA